jgi:hypothetical protein
MRKWWNAFKDKFWPLSALLCGPWQAPLVLSVASRLSADTALGAFILDNYNSIKSVLLLVLSLYFMLAFMMWAVGRRRPTHVTRHEMDEADEQAVMGLSLKQIIGWGCMGMVTLPILIALSAMTNQAYFIDTFKHISGQEPTINPGFIWLISLSTVIMIPIMVIWLIWMWRAWSNTNDGERATESWGYEYD